MSLRIIFFFICGFLPLTLLAESYHPPFRFGHILSPTTDTLEKGQFTVGSMAIGGALGDRLMIATSPFLYYGYNSHSVILRGSFEKPEERKWAFQTLYVKSGEFGRDLYRMEVLSAWATRKFTINSHMELNWSLNYMHFFDETIPYSLRQEPFHDRAGQYSTTLLVSSWSESGWGWNGEAGVLGLDYTYPFLHMGLSAFYSRKSYLVQVGLSLDTMATRVSETYFDAQRVEQTTAASTIFHPEIQLQFFF